MVMRKLVVVSLALFVLALSLFFLADCQRANAAGNDLRAAAGPNLIHELVAPDSPATPAFRFINLLGFAFLAGSLITLAADRRARDKQYD